MTGSEKKTPLNTKLTLPAQHKGCEQGTYSNNRTQIRLLKLDTGRYHEGQMQILILRSSVVIVFAATGTKISKQICVQIKLQQLYFILLLQLMD